METIYLIVIVVVILFVSFLISHQVYKKMRKANFRWAVPVSILIFMGCFAIITATIGFIILSQIDFGR